MITEHPQSASPTGPGGCPPWRVLVLHDITTPLLTHLHDTPVAIRRCFSVPTSALRNSAQLTGMHLMSMPHGRGEKGGAVSACP
ncbi:hypothetical protein SCLCIDRAFT_1222081 [Scleroderma citrinum Foug A]|uniref:Uncharacterized protein n=1 Tax=Scleroderma citrinum Foug A TaxID=1036808 RepID=A0A0C2ZP39_9AGAM|nr:hypothetical protein SCLCIDRAFT_1222081 [Scleroderma citrinum Foug A]